MISSQTFKSQKVFALYFLAAVLLLIPAISLAGNSAPFVTKIRVTGNTLVDPFDINRYLNLGNGLHMTPEIMDMVVSELNANFNYLGYPHITAYSSLKVKNGVMTIKVDESEEYRWGKPRAERATLKSAFLHDITLKESKKQKIIEKLMNGYKKQKMNEEIVAKFLMNKQKKRIEEIHSQRRASLRENIFEKVKEYQSIKKNIAEEEARRIVGMRERVQSASLRKYDDSPAESPLLVSDEYTNLDEFLDNAIFDEMLKPGL
jgi:hypothetical protein